MRVIPLQSLAVPEKRQRQHYDPEALSNLCDDIAENGLHHAPVVRDLPDGSIMLVAGERRRRAIEGLAEAGIAIRYDGRDIPLDHLPVVTVGEVSAVGAFKIEYGENFIREDLTWQEAAVVLAELNTILKAEAEAEGRKHFYVDTAEVAADRKLRGTTLQTTAQTAVRNAVVLAQHLNDPAVAKAKTATEAVKIVEKKVREDHYRQLAERLGASQTTYRHKLVQGHALLKLREMPVGQFDCIVADPPYGIEAHKFGEQSDGRAFDDSYEGWLALMQGLAPELLRVAKSEAHAYIFCDIRNFNELRAIFLQADWYVWETPLIWYKSDLSGTLPRPEHAPRRVYESILYAIRGDKRVTNVYSDVLAYPTTSGQKLHPDQKPVSIYVDLLRRSCRPGSVVLDPCCGSGTIFPAANQLQLTATGIENEPVAFAIASTRLREQH